MSWIVKIIEEQGGAVPFSAYMGFALYHPERGYYSQPQARYGRDGDFLTAPTASPWYGRVFSRFLRQLSRSRGPLILVDLASGDGSFLEVVLEELAGSKKPILSRIVAVEQSPAMRRRSQTRLGSGMVEYRSTLDQAPAPKGPVVLHACELFDALPADRVVGDERGGLLEFWVAAKGDALVWEKRPARREVEAYFASHDVELSHGQVAECSRTTAEMHRSFLEWAGQEGLAVVLDYGYDPVRLYDPRGRAQGSLACYRRHELTRDPLDHPGEQDLTTHVNWDDLRSAAGMQSFHEVSLWPLAEFLVRAGLAEVADIQGVGIEAEIDSRTYAARQEIKRLLDPEGMGSDLKVLIQGRGAIADAAAEVLESVGPR